MQVTTKGLVLREVKTGEADRIISILTPEMGIISASARGSMRPKSKLFSATGLFCYSEFTLFEGRTMYRVDEAEALEIFFGLRENMDGVALAVYIAELLQILSPAGQEGETLLQLALNSLYLLSQKKLSPRQVKPVFELRALSESGFMPDLLACEACGKYQDRFFRFGPHHGTLLCGECAEKKGRQANLDAPSLAAMRHIVLADARKVFSFELKENSLWLLCRAVEDFVLCHLDYPPKSLAFLKAMLA
ncbi:MAG: DNA repair protein RecO [Oscillospiraceae bacterium]